MSTFFMNLTLPEPREALSPTWATQLNTALTSVDTHTHESSSGQRLTSAGININTDLSFSSNSVTNADSIVYQNKTAVFTTNNSVWVKGGELYFRDNASNNAKITSGGSINFIGVGGVDGDYSSTLAAFYYTDSTKEYTLEDSNSNPSSIVVKNIENTTIDASSLTIGAVTANAAASFQEININGSTTISGDMALNGNNSGRGIIPIGAVMALATNLTGVSVPTGYSLLDGSTISDPSSPMDGVVLPNLNNSVFLAGHSTAGTTGGTNSYSLAEAQLPAHVHTINNSHADTFALSNATSQSTNHTHTMPHTHMWAHFQYDAAVDFMGVLHSRSASDTTSTTINDSDADIIKQTETTTNGLSSAVKAAFLFRGSLGDKDKLYTSGVIDAPTGSGSTAVTGVEGTTNTVTFSGAVTDHIGNSGSIGSGSSIDNKPNYISTQFIVRIK